MERYSNLRAYSSEVRTLSFLWLCTLLQVLGVRRSTGVNILFFFIRGAYMLLGRLMVSTLNELLRRVGHDEVVRVHVYSTSRLITTFTIGNCVNFGSRQVVNYEVGHVSVIFSVLSKGSASTTSHVNRVLIGSVFVGAGYLGGLKALVQLSHEGARLNYGLCGANSGYVIVVVGYNVVVFIWRILISRLFCNVRYRM